MPIPFLNSIKLNKNQVEDFCVFNYSGDPTLSSGADFGYLWLNTSATPKVLKFWDGTNYRTLIDSTTISSSTAGTANDLSGGVAGSLPYQQGVGDTTFLGIGTADQVLTVNSGATAPQWLSQSSLSVGSATTATTATTATNVAGGANGSILVQSGAGTTGQLAIGANGYILTSNGTTPGWSATIPSTSVSGLAASATTDTTNASNISSGTLGLARLSLATGQFYVGDASNNPAATAKSSIPLSGFGAAGADVAMGGFKITGLADPAAATDAATRGYVDSVAQGLDVKASCLVATTADITLASPGAVTIDGIYSATDFTAGTTRILVKDQSAPAENGIYIWQGPSSAMTRSADADTWDELVGAFTFIERGTANADSGWVCTSNAGGTLGTTAVTFVKFSQAGSYTAGNGIVQSGTSFNFAQSTPYTAGQIPFAKDADEMTFSANLHWDNSNNSLGIGTNNPSAQTAKLAVIGGDIAVSASSLFKVIGAGYTNSIEVYNGGDGSMNLSVGFPTAPLVAKTNGSERLRIASDGVCTWSNVGGVAGTAMTLNGTGLGVGTASPSTALQVVGTGVAAVGTINIKGSQAHIGLTSAAGSFKGWLGYFNTADSGSDLDLNIKTGYSGSSNIRLGANADATHLFIAGSGNVGIGTTTPAGKLSVVTTSSNGGSVGSWGAYAAFGPNAGSATGAGVGISYNTSLDQGEIVSAAPATGWKTLALYCGGLKAFSSNGSLAATLDSSGNLGLGVTPKAWRTSVVFKAFQIGYTGALYSLGASEQVNLASNYYQDTSGNELRIENGYVTRYQQASGAHIWSNAGTGNAGTGFTLTPAMTLDASGNLAVGGSPTATHRILAAGPSAWMGLQRTSGVTNVLEYLDSSGVRLGYIGYVNNELHINQSKADKISFATGSTPAERLSIKSTGQVNFNGLASDPAGAAGDVYYNSGSNLFRVYDTGWKTLPRKYSTALAGTSTTFDVTHNLGTQDVTVMVRKSASTFDVVYTDIQVATTNKVTIVFASSVTGSDYTVTVIG